MADERTIQTLPQSSDNDAQRQLDYRLTNENTLKITSPLVRDTSSASHLRQPTLEPSFRHQ